MIRTKQNAIELSNELMQSVINSKTFRFPAIYFFNKTEMTHNYLIKSLNRYVHYSFHIKNENSEIETELIDIASFVWKNRKYINNSGAVITDFSSIDFYKKENNILGNKHYEYIAVKGDSKMIHHIFAKTEEEAKKQLVLEEGYEIIKEIKH